MTMTIRVLTPAEIQAQLQERHYPAQKSYLAMYSTWWDGIIKDPSLMVVPIDDHLVHRGDGVFEAIKIIGGNIFLLDEHLNRLALSAELISLPLPRTLQEIKSILFQTAREANATNALLRLYISRGPGGFTTNPYESIASQMYLVVTSFAAVAEEKYRNGVKVGRSQVPPKDPWFARIKSCNYLPNVLMKKESVDRQIDFTIGFDERGVMTESSTENIVLVDKDGHLVRPRLKQILKGTTMMRAFELAEVLISSQDIQSISERDISEADLQSAREVMMIGTTLDVLPVTEYEGRKIGSGAQGPVAAKLLALLRADIKSGPKATPLT